MVKLEKINKSISRIMKAELVVNQFHLHTSKKGVQIQFLLLMQKKLESTIQARKVSYKGLMPFMGTYNFYKENNVKEIHEVKPENICKDTAVITINNRHVGALMGGYEKYLAKEKKSEHVMLFGPINGTEKPLAKILDNKNELSAGLAIYTAAGSIVNSCLSQFLPAFVVYGLVPITGMWIASRICQELGFGSPINLMMQVISVQGNSEDELIASTYKPVPLIGLDISAMRQRASEIKKQGEYQFLIKNCSWSILECLKAGLSKEVVDKLPSTGLYITPTDVQKTIDFLVDNGHVLLGEMDEDGFAWFDAQTTQVENS